MENNDKQILLLNSNWTFSLYRSSKELEQNKYYNIKSKEVWSATVPGTIHIDLMDNKLIDDPFYSDNEKKLDGISESDWLYRNEFKFFKVPEKRYQLVLDGLDTVANVILNGDLIGSTKNMFCKYKFDITEQLSNGTNILEVILFSPTIYCQEREAEQGKLEVALNSSRVYLRKAQYSYGWDWGPILTTSGIWKDVYIESKIEPEISTVLFNTISIAKNKAEAEIRIKLIGTIKKYSKLEVSLSNGEQIINKHISNAKKNNVIKIRVDSPKLWYPNGYGQQNLYNLEINLIDINANSLDKQNRVVGIRKIELITQAEGKTTFGFKVNGQLIFAKGANWIPADSFLPRIKYQKYYDLLKAAKDSGMNIIRVWGGGIYEDDKFYDLCDEFGLLIWQDFMFACAAYPEDDAFLKDVKEEIVQNIERLQCHPSIALWCGNNENEWLWYQNQGKHINQMPGYKIFNSIIPKILMEIDPYANYWQSSPFGNEKDPNSSLSGNRHQWNLWSGWADYKEVEKDKSLFVTEFGFQAPANIDTFKQYLPDVNRYYRDEIFEFHNKQIEGQERVIKFLSSHLPIYTKWEDFIYLTQLNQGFALRTCLEHWLANNETNGTIIWQLNDCWPVTSWSLIDSNSKPKLSYYFVKEIFSANILSYKSNDYIDIINFDSARFDGNVKMTIISADSGEIVDSYQSSVSIKANCKEKLKFDKNFEMDINNIYVVSLSDGNNKLIHRNCFLKKEWKHIKLKPSEINIDCINENDSGSLLLSSKAPNFFVDIYQPKITFNKRGFILLPGEQIDIKYIENGSKIKKSEIMLFTLNDYLTQ